MKHFFEFRDYRDFLRYRYEIVRATRPRFSVRAFAADCKVNSPSYFSLVLEGKRKLSVDYARRFARGLKLTALETQCLEVAVALERAKTPREKSAMLHQLQKLESRAGAAVVVAPSHVKILSDLVNLKIYLLAQSHAFQFSNAWIARELGGIVTALQVEERVGLLLSSGLWKLAHGKIVTVAPSISTGDRLTESYLHESHLALLDASKRAVREQDAAQRIANGQTFLFDRKRLPEVEKRMEDFKRALEADFECLDAKRVYQLHMTFFEILPGDKP